MKNLFTLLTLCLTFGLFAQSDVVLKINHKLGSDDFAMNSAVSCYDGYNIKVIRLEYYLNDFKIYHDGGVESLAPQHHLVNTNGDTQLSLGNFDITQVDSITFSVGVHPDKNHLDPSVYAGTNPLAPQNPSMHWGWAAGYRFVALEGKAGPTTSTTYEIHALGDVNYKTLTVHVNGSLDGNTYTIGMDADYFGMFNGVNVSSGLITHGEVGASVSLMNNFATEVFYPEGAIPVKTIDPNFEGKFQIQPNPSVDNTTNVILNLPTANDYQLVLTDLTGRVIQTQKVQSGEQSIELTSKHSGMYFIHLWKDGAPVAYEKWIVK